jgi:hypothetical protein
MGEACSELGFILAARGFEVGERLSTRGEAIGDQECHMPWGIGEVGVITLGELGDKGGIEAVVVGVKKRGGGMAGHCDKIG